MFLFFNIFCSSVFASLKKSRWEDTRLATKPVLENLKINQAKKSPQFQINKEKWIITILKKKKRRNSLQISTSNYDIWEVSTLTNYKILVLSKNIACEATKELGWLSISPDCSKSDISNSYLLFYVPSASRHYSAIKMCLKDISYCQREYPRARLCCYWQVRVEIGLRLIFFLLETILKRKKTIERMSI